VVKGDLVMAKVIKAAVRARQRLVESPIRIPLDDGTTVVLRPRAVAAARARARSTGKPHNDARVTFVQHLLDDLANQVAEQRHFDLDDEHTRAEVVADLRDNVGVRREINLRWMPLSPEKLIHDLLTKPARLAEAAAGLIGPAKQLALLRSPDDAWTVADVPLLDEAAELIGADVAVSGPAAAAARAARQEAIDYAQGVLDAAGDVASMMTAEALVDRFADAGPTRTLAERAGADRSWTYGHAVVDEAQELSAMQWRMLIRRVPSRSMTVVGDVAQTGSAAGTTSWAEALDQHAEGRWLIEELTVNYRTPAKIVELATSVLAAAGQKPGHATTAREGDWEPVIRRFTQHALPGSQPGSLPDSHVQDVVAALREDDALLGGGQFAVIAPRALAGDLRAALRRVLAAEPLAERVVVHTVDDVKGLEFDTVVVLLPRTIAEESPRGVNDLYVALTRPTQRATLLHDGTLPAPLSTE
jgi:DNA helicase IV